MMCVFIGTFAAHIWINGQNTLVGVCGYKCSNKKIVQRYIPYGSYCPGEIKLSMAYDLKPFDPLRGSPVTKTQSENEDDASQSNL